MDEFDGEMGDDIAAIERIKGVPTMLSVLCDITGMGFSAIARVNDTRWVACAVNDGIGFGLRPGAELPLNSTLCHESRMSAAPIVISDAATDPVYKDHHTPRIYGIRSYVSVPIVFSDGHYFGNLCAIDPNPAAVGSPRILAVFTKFARLIAEQLDVERSLKAARAELVVEKESAALREEFTAILGHDLRNPLAGIVSWADVVAARAEDPKIQRAAGRIKASAKRMGALIDDTLDLARGRLGGGVPARVARVENLGVGLAGVVAELVQAHPERDTRSRIDVDGPVFCDESRIHQLASNLLGNAMTHGDPNGPVQLSASKQDDVLTIEVWNSGPVIPADSMALVFKPFWRSAASNDRHGLGLGLYICDMIAKSHGGTLAVTSTTKSGTTFTARIPVAPNPALTS